MLKNWVTFLSISVFVVNFGCSGPSVTSSANTSTESRGLNPPSGEAKSDKAEATLAAGTVIRASLNHSLSTEKNTAGDAFTMKVVDSVKVDDRTIVPIGSTIKGVVSESARSG